MIGMCGKRYDPGGQGTSREGVTKAVYGHRF